METVAHGGRRQSQKLTLEEYLLFVDNNKLADDFTVGQLNQIIDFHGYKRLHKTPKKILSEAVGTLELMKPSRSTLQDADVSSCAMMSLDSIVKDLNDLGWQECCVTSIQMLNSVDLQPQQPLKSNPSTASGSEAKKPKKQQKKLMKLLINNADSTNEDTNCGGDDNVGVCSGLGTSGSGSTSCSSVIHGGGADKARKLMPKRKRKRSPRVAGDSNGGGGTGGSALVC